MCAIALCGNRSQLRSVTCYVGSQRVPPNTDERTSP